MSAELKSGSLLLRSSCHSAAVGRVEQIAEAGLVEALVELIAVAQVLVVLARPQLGHELDQFRLDAIETGDPFLAERAQHLFGNAEIVFV